ncbi:DNA polymerase III subunit delta' [Cohnella fermenti]|uniref:DNA polymerase III subunit delta n=1 Tax=Cohnella fermenti TaxID=2565925 RepID=A0A4S4BIN0_9BACL|nr:DNA polymerase III subunit delta' [Cohnella fermenti]THF74465.1 DNA polymerase III subunit delta' [Cohnella fermenti]
MAIQEVPGQRRAKALLHNSLRTGKIAHAYLFAGPQGSGKKAMALAFAQTLFCERQGTDACGECLACRKVLHGNHPDLHLVEPDGATVKIEQVRELQKELSFRSAGAGRKVYIIEGAETMTTPAANSLLKFLEEPASPIVAMLLAPSAQSVLPTILSRSQLVSFVPGDPDELEQLLVAEGKPALLARAAVHMTSGIDAARALCQENWFAETRNVVIQLGKENSSKFPAALLTAQQQVFKTDLAEHTDTLLQMFALWYRDMIYIITGRENRIVFSDQAEWMARHAWSRSLDSHLAAMEGAMTAARRIKAHVQPQLALEQFLVKSREG